MQPDSRIFDFKWGTAFLAIAFVYVLISFVNNNFIFTETYYFNSLGSRLDSSRIHEIFIANKKLQWLAYLFVPVIVLAKLFIISGVIYAGVILFNDTLEFKTILKLTILAETIMILAGVVKLIYLIITGAGNVANIQSFYPLSILNVLNVSRIPAYLIYPLQQINLFELCYWLVIAFGVKILLKQSFSRSLYIIASSYGVSLLIWIMAITFIQIQFS